MKLRPLHDNVLVKRDTAPDRTEGGILLPDAAKDKPRRGTVLAVGPGLPVDGTANAVRPMAVKKDDKILFAPFGGSEVEVGGEKLLILAEKEILAVIA